MKALQPHTEFHADKVGTGGGSVDDGFGGLKTAIEEIVALDIRTQQHKRGKDERTVWAFYYDNLNIVFKLATPEDDDTFEISLVEKIVSDAEMGIKNNTCWKSFS